MIARVLIGAIAIALATAAVAGPAAAEPDRAAIQRARDHYARGERLHRLGNYREAAQAFLDAYALYPDPEFHFNAGQAYRLAGDRERAIASYRRYLELDHDGRVSADARRWVSELEARRPAEQPGARAPSQTVIQVVNPPADDRTALRWTSISVAGVGAVSIGAGVVFAVKARRIEHRLEGYDEWTVDRLAEIDEGRRARNLAWVLSSVGAAALVTGGVVAWFGWRPSQDPTADVAIAPALSRDAVSVVATGRF